MRSAQHRIKRTFKQNATETSEGFIPHLEICGDFGIIHAPVCIVPGLRGWKGDPMPMPMRRDGKLVYALPGPGGRTVTA